MSEFEDRIKAIFAAGDERGQRVKGLLDESDELTSLVLRGHLVLEELLVAAVAAHCQVPEHLEAARLRFPQLVALLRALEKMPVVPDSHWEALLKFNALRNSLAHQLEPKDLHARVDALAAVVAKSVDGKVPKPESPRQALEYALYYLVGAFEVVGVWQAVLEELIQHQVSKSS